MAEGATTTVSNSRARDLPRSPTSMSPTSSRRESLRSSNNTERESASSSSPARLTRKRAASLDTEAANHPSIQDLSIHSSGLDSPRTDSGNHVCLCQPDPKIPRPRNAFILYRQHYQGQVIAQNPGLANPEISKIIGALWREQPLEVKNEWKRLAEEEKHRHQRQYPDYRYQPRRAGKPNSSRAISSPDEHLRCPKCNGRFISTPNTPLTPFPPTPPTASRIDRPPSTFSRPAADEMMDTDRNYSNPAAPLNTPRAGPPYQQMQHRRPPVPLDQSGRPYRDEEIEMLQSPRIKRPRPNDLQNSYSPAWPNGPQRLNRGPISAAGYDSARVPNQRGIVYQQHGNHGMMEPPPRPTPMSAQFPPHTPTHVRPQNMDDLRLPPLQTQLPGPGSAPLQQQQHQPQSQQNNSLSHSRTIEAMIMTIPFLNKIKVLAKIAPPLSTPGPTSPAQEVRGPVIAVEGADQKLVAEVGRYIEEHLNKEAEYFVKTWISDNASFGNHSEPTTGDVSMGGTDKDAPVAIDLTKDNEDTDPIFEYLKEIGTWHDKSAEIRKFITTLPTTTPSSASRTSSASSNPPASPSCSPTSTPAPPPTPAPSSTAPPPPRLPVALLPTGFSLSISDRAASKIPIEDAYAPVDHWQWMATLWRGIVGVDLTVYVCSSARGEEDGGRGGPPAAGGVEVRTDARAILVRAQNERVEDKWLRRVGFEVGEWVRGGGGGTGLKG